MSSGEAEPRADIDAQSNSYDHDEADPAAVKPYVFELHGSQLESRATDRATRKFKQRRMDEL